MRPKYFVRKDDNAIFSLNEDGETYSLKAMKDEFPGHLNHKYDFDALHNDWEHFFICSDEDMEMYELRYHYVGLHVNAAREKAAKKGISSRVTSKGNQPFIITHDFKAERLNFRLNDEEIVVSVGLG
jgi:hypothetical protein